MRRQYDRLCDSCIDWLGDLPTHWHKMPLRWLASYRTSSVDKKTDADEIPVRLCNYTDVYYSERIRSSDGEFMAATATSHEVERFGLRPGDVLITKDSEDWRDIGVPALVEASSDDFVCGYHLGIVRPGEEIDPGYLFRALLSDGVNKQLQVSATGVTRYGIPNGSVNGAVLPYPPLGEQRAIVSYLDRETARVDELITKKELLIERLDEYRTALITRTVTEGLPRDVAESAGLDPEPKLKDSGVEWLGEVPEHWQLARVRRVARLKAGDAIAADDITDAGAYAVFGGNGTRGFTDRYSHELTAVLVGRQGALCGNVHIATGRFWASEHAVVAEPLVDVNAYWLAYLLDAMKLNQYSMAAAQPGLAIDRVNDLSVPLLPAREQRGDC